eukprot:GHVP01067952.1.p2 GENE.GHVP01067952.1~~GHVP01067952.1.p2  ORF type:complete len:163 (+),score=27.41 GHVP01067952.1:303-791(+)
MLRAPRMGTEEMDSSNTASSTEQAEAEKFASLYYKRTRADGKKVLWLLLPEIPNVSFTEVLGSVFGGNRIWLSKERSWTSDRMLTDTFSFCCCEDPKLLCEKKSCGERTFTNSKADVYALRLSKGFKEVLKIFKDLDVANFEREVRCTNRQATKWNFIHYQK